VPGVPPVEHTGSLARDTRPRTVQNPVVAWVAGPYNPN